MQVGNLAGQPAAIVALSLGWGVDSWALAAMSALGELPPIDVAIHADTGHERTPTRTFARKWSPWLEDRGIPVVTVTPKDNRVIQRGAIMPPVYTVSSTGKPGMAPRQCNRDWKVRPVKRYVRRMIRERGLKLLPGTVQQWIAFNADERSRADPLTSRVAYIVHGFPLVELGIGREDAIAWLQDHGLEIPASSSCVFCPFHDDGTWEEIANHPEDRQRAVDVDRELRNGHAGRRYTSYLHSARRPLEDVFRGV
jgi:hypothetical protein